MNKTTLESRLRTLIRQWGQDAPHMSADGPTVMRMCRNQIIHAVVAYSGNHQPDPLLVDCATCNGHVTEDCPECRGTGWALTLHGTME